MGKPGWMFFTSSQMRGVNHTQMELRLLSGFGEEVAASVASIQCRLEMSFDRSPASGSTMASIATFSLTRWECPKFQPRSGRRQNIFSQSVNICYLRQKLYRTSVYPDLLQKRSGGNPLFHIHIWSNAAYIHSLITFTLIHRTRQYFCMNYIDHTCMHNFFQNSTRFFKFMCYIF